MSVFYPPTRAFECGINRIVISSIHIATSQEESAHNGSNLILHEGQVFMAVRCINLKGVRGPDKTRHSVDFFNDKIQV